MNARQPQIGDRFRHVGTRVECRVVRISRGAVTYCPVYGRNPQRHERTVSFKRFAELAG